MSADRRKSDWAFWTITVFLVLMLAYPLSFGPLVGLGSRELLPEFAKPALMFLYGPLISLVDDPPRPIAPVVRGYVQLFMKSAPAPLIFDPVPIPATGPLNSE